MARRPTPLSTFLNDLLHEHMRREEPRRQKQHSRPTPQNSTGLPRSRSHSDPSAILIHQRNIHNDVKIVDDNPSLHIFWSEKSNVETTELGSSDAGRLSSTKEELATTEASFHPPDRWHTTRPRPRYSKLPRLQRPLPRKASTETSSPTVMKPHSDKNSISQTVRSPRLILSPKARTIDQEQAALHLEKRWSGGFQQSLSPVSDPPIMKCTKQRSPILVALSGTRQVNTETSSTLTDTPIREPERKLSYPDDFQHKPLASAATFVSSLQNEEWSTSSSSSSSSNDFFHTKNTQVSLLLGQAIETIDAAAGLTHEEDEPRGSNHF